MAEQAARTAEPPLDPPARRCWKQRVKTLELKLPPPVVMVLTGLAMWLLAAWLPAFDFEAPAREVLAFALVAVGLASGVAGILAFRRVGTTVHPQRPHTSTTVVHAGIYRFSRNPMYLGLLLVLAGFAVVLANLLAFALLPLFVAWMNRFQIGPEERALSAKFGAAYDGYRARVRRWL